MDDIAVIEEIPSADEFVALREAAGLSATTLEAAGLGLPRSIFAVCARSSQALVGMARVVGDGGCHFHIVDVAVHPDYQRKGIGTQMMEMLMSYVREHAPESAYVSLLADTGAPALYRKFGFEFTAPNTVGMALRM